MSQTTPIPIHTPIVTQNKKVMKNKNYTPKTTKKQECTICCDDVFENLIITCINHICDFSCCKTCLKRYLVDHPMNTKCMECDTLFSHTLLIDFFGKTFVISELRKLQKKVLLERQLAQIPATQISNEFKRLKTGREIYKLKKEFKEMTVAERYEKINEYRTKIQELTYLLYQVVPNETHEEKGPSIIMKCTKDNCRGFVTSQKYKCEVCETAYCKKCVEEITKEQLETKDPEKKHQCNDDDVETAKLILNESNPCPSCGTRITKLSGCDQMWCIQCHVSFSWRTGKIEKGVVHNPHYFEWIRKGGVPNEGIIRNPRDVHCGGLPNVARIANFINNGKTFTDVIFNYNNLNNYNFFIDYNHFMTIKNLKSIMSQNIGKWYTIRVSYIQDFINKYPELNTIWNLKFFHLCNGVKEYTTMMEDTLQRYENMTMDQFQPLVYNLFGFLNGTNVTLSSLFETPIIECVSRHFQNTLNKNANFKEVTDLFYIIYSRMAHIIGHIDKLRNHIQNVQNEHYMFRKRVDFLLKNKSEKQLAESASRREYTIMRQRSKLHLYELIEMVGIEETRSLEEELLKIIKETIFDGTIEFTEENEHLRFLRTDVFEEFHFPEMTFLTNDISIQAEQNLKDKIHQLVEKYCVVFDNFNTKLINAFSYYNEQMKIISDQYNCKVEYVNLHDNTIEICDSDCDSDFNCDSDGDSN